MASSNTALSRTAINALRGVLFTTSCSVVLLAEERRRRIKIARAAVDNARKIHAAKASRGSVSHATVEPFNPEACLAALEGESFVTASGAPGNPYSHRGRRDTLSSSDARSSLRNATRQDEHQTIQAQWLSAAAAAAQLATSAMDVTSTKMTVDEKMRLGRHGGSGTSGTCSGTKVTLNERMKIGQKDESGTNINRSGTMAPISKELAWKPPRPRTNVIPQKSTLLTEKLSDARKKEKLAAQIMRRIFNKPESEETDDSERALRMAVRTLLDRIDELPKSCSESAVSLAAFDEAVEALLQIKFPDRPRSRINYVIQGVALDLLRYSLTLGPNSTTKVLEASLSLPIPFMRVAKLFLRSVQQNHPTMVAETVSNMVRFCTKPGQSEIWQNGLLVEEVLRLRDDGNIYNGNIYEEISDDASLTTRLYAAFKAAGLFTEIEVSQEAEYMIRRAAFVAGCEEGHDALMESELQILSQTWADDVKTDFVLQSALVCRKSALGSWKTIFDDLDNLASMGDQEARSWQQLLQRITDTFTKQHSPQQVQHWLERLANHYNMVIPYQFAFVVLDEYARHHDVDGMMTWLQFCFERGLKIDTDFASQLDRSCRKYLHCCDRQINLIHEMLRQEVRVPQGKKDKHHSLSRRKLSGRCAVVSGRMQMLRRSGQLDEVCAEFDAALVELGPGAAGLLSLALTARLEQDELERASELLARAEVFGICTVHHRDELARAGLRNCGSAAELIRRAGRNKVKLPNWIQSTATNELAWSGNMAGATAYVRQLAGAKHGGGGPESDEFIFAKNVSLSMGMYRYDMLEAVLTEYMSEHQSWHGSRKACDSLKWAIKELTKRSMAGKDDKMLPLLEDALDHWWRCRVPTESFDEMLDMITDMARGYKALSPRTRVNAAPESHIEQAPELPKEAELPQTKFRRGHTVTSDAELMTKARTHTLIRVSAEEC